MVLVRTNVSEEVYGRLVNDEEVEAITNFDKVGFQEPYQFLKELSGFDNFFFGFAAESNFAEEINDLCLISTKGNSVPIAIRHSSRRNRCNRILSIHRLDLLH